MDICTVSADSIRCEERYSANNCISFGDERVSRFNSLRGALLLRRQSRISPTEVSADSIRCGERYRRHHRGRGSRPAVSADSIRCGERYAASLRLDTSSFSCQPIQFAAGSATLHHRTRRRWGRCVSRFNSLRGALHPRRPAGTSHSGCVSRFNSLRGALPCSRVAGEHRHPRVSRFNSLRGALRTQGLHAPRNGGVSADSIRCGERYCR